MSLKCRVFRDEKGQIDFVNAENGNRSKLFDKLVEITGGNKNTALNIYALTEVDELKEAMGAKLNALKERFKNIVKVAPETSPMAGEVMFSKTATKPTYFSNAIVAISNLADKNPKNTQGWLKQLTDTQKNGGIKNVNQELEWIGLEDYLTSYVKENSPKAGNIPASVVEDYIKSNQIEIVDVSKGGFAERDRMNALRNQAQREGNYDLVNYYDDEVLPGLRGNQPTKYEGYQLKGGENYREVLLTIPAKPIENNQVFTVKNRKEFWKDLSNFSAEEVEDGFLVSSIRGGKKLIEKDYFIKTKEDAINSYREDNLQLLDIFSEEQGVEDYDFYDENGTYFNTSTAANIGQAISEYKSLTETKQDEYKSSHWSEGNILAHVRLNEKTLPDGRKVLIVNEMQSDWAQDGRKKGFVDKKKVAEREVLRLRLQAEKDKVRAIESKLASLQPLTKEEKFELNQQRLKLEEARSNVRNNREWDALGEEIDKIEEQLNNYENTKNRLKSDRYEINYIQENSISKLEGDLHEFDNNNKYTLGDVGQMPYKNTDQWVGLATRRVLQMAAQEGYDGVSFATGKQSADMYSLAKQVDNISWDTTDNTLTAFDKNGNKQFQESNITDEKLEDFVGKEVAQKLINRKENLLEEDEGVVALENADLEIGGEGMKTFYDNILTKVAQKEAQRFDKNAKLGSVDFGDGDLKVINASKDSDFPDFIWVNSYGEKVSDGFSSEEQALKNKPKIATDKLSLAEQPFIAITDKMRSELGKAIPMFSKNQGQEAPREVLDQVIDRLKQSGLANNVYQMTNAQIEAKLIELGVSAGIAKQVTISDTDVATVNFNTEEDFWDVYLKDGSYIEVYLPENSTEEEVKKEAALLVREYLLDAIPTVYRGINGQFSPDFKGVQYFAVNKRYAGVFGRNIEEFRLKSPDILDLDNWNKKWGVENVDFGQGLLTVHQDNLSDLKEWKTRIKNSLIGLGIEVPKEELDSFIKEVENAKIIKGEDIGNIGQIVFAVKDKNLVEPINKDIQFSKGLNKEGVQLTTAGFTYKGDVYLNTDAMGLDTPIHEFGHLHLDWLKENRTDLYQAGLSLIGKNKEEAQQYIDIVKETQPDLKEGTEKFNNEVLAQVIGDQGAKLVNSKKEGSIAEWLKNVWDSIKDILGLTSYTADEVANMTLADFGTASATEMLSGNRISRNMGENNVYLRYKYDVNQVARERFDIPNLKEISSGSDRVVFDLGDGKVLKVANTARGLAQNMQEGDSELINKGLLPQVYETGLNYVVVEKLEALENKTKVPVYDISNGKQYDTEDADVMIQELTPYGQADFDTRNPDLIEVLKSYGLQDFLDYDIIYGDLTNIANWGIKEGKPVHLDAGTFGGMYMIRAYARRKDMSFKDFENVYNKTQEAKAKFGDTDTNVNFSVVSGNKLFNEPLEEAGTIAYEYISEKGLSTAPIQKITKLDTDNSKRIAQEFDKMKPTPNDPETKAAYNAMVEETLEQYEKILSRGYKVEINNSEPYDSSADMIADLRDNKRMKIFSTESGFGDEAITDKQREDNLLLQQTKYKDANGIPLLANDVFRFVHDFFGHAKFGNGFGAVGEENAWNIHSRMYSPLARRAMTTETRGQNSWVNFSGANDEVFKKRDKARVLRQEGKLEEAKKLTEEVYNEMSFAEQKVGLLPEWVSTPKTENISPENSSNYANLTEDGEGNFVFYHVGKSGYDVIKRTSGDTINTSREEAQALAKVGGLAMYYSKPEDGETMITGESKYMVKIPISKVYDFNTDSLNLTEKAKELHSKEHPGKSFDANTQVAYVTKVAADFGYEMVVAEWQNRTRAQSIKEHKPNDIRVSEGATIKKPFQENYESNSSKGFKSVIPVPKKEQLKQLYLDLNNYRNRENRYDDIYRLYEEYSKLSQEEIKKRIENSDIPQEYKSKYESIVSSKEGKRMSILPVQKSVIRQPSLELNGTKIFAKDRINPITGEKLDGIEWELIESTERGQGNARKAAELFLNGTDAQEKDVYLTISPRDTTTKPEKLESFYSSLGFKKTSDFEMVRKARPVSLKDTDSNGEPSIKTLMDFSNSKSKPLGLEGLKAAKNAAMALKVKSSKELVEKMEKALMKNGIVLFDKLSLQRSKLYNNFEINTILSSPKLQKQIKESLLSLRNSEPFEIEYDENFIVPQGREVNQFGKQDVINPNLVENELMQSVAGLEESEIDEALPDSLVNRYYTDSNFKETVDAIAKDYKKAPIKTVVDGELIDKTEDVEGMLLNTLTEGLDDSITRDVAFLRSEIDEEIFSSNLTRVSKVLNMIKKNAYINGIDLRNLPTLALELSRSEILGFLDSMEDVIKDPSNPENFMEFTERYYKILGDKELKTEVIKSNSQNDVIVEEPLSEYEMFSEFDLVKKDDGIYRKVQEQSLDSLYESFFEYKNLLPEGIESIEALKVYVQKNASLLEVSDYEVDVDNLEKIFLYKKFFDFPMSTQSPRVNTENFNKITNPEDYLTDDFVKDFNKWLLTTANPYFKVTSKGIELVNKDELSKTEAVNSVPERFKQELAEYNIISDNLNLDMPLLEEKYEDINTQLEQRQKAVNNPDRVKKVSGQYTYLKDGVLAAKNESETFVKTPIGIFEKIFEFENVKFYGKLDTSKNQGYKKVSIEAPFSDINFKDYMYLASTPEAFKTSKNYYSKKELDDINEEYFGCQ